MIYQGWKSQRTLSGTGSQWQHLESGWLFLNADMAIGYPISTALPPLQGQHQLCGPHASVNTTYGCRAPSNVVPPSSWPLSVAYAANNTMFVEAFAVAYTKMSTVGYGVPAAVDGAISTGKLGTLTAIDLTTC